MGAVVVVEQGAAAAACERRLRQRRAGGGTCRTRTPGSHVCQTPPLNSCSSPCSIRCAQLQRRPRLLPFFFPLTRSCCDPAEVSASLFLRHTHPPPALLSFLVPPTPLTCFLSIFQLPPLLPGPCCPPVRAKQFRRQDGAHRRGAACRRSRRAKRCCSCAKCHSRRGCVSSCLRLFSMALQLQGRDTIKCIYSHSWALIRASLNFMLLLHVTCHTSHVAATTSSLAPQPLPPTILPPLTPLLICPLPPPLLPGPSCAPFRAKQFRRQDGAHRRGSASR